MVVLASATVAALVARAALRARPTRADVAGRSRRAELFALEVGAHLLQRPAPLAQFGLHLVGFHPMRDDPTRQMTAHHFCHQVNDDFMQCLIFDSHRRDARLTGVEYIVSGRLYDELPEDEKRLWHPHDYEILSGQLVAPGIPGRIEKELMRGKIGSYGKTWHFWTTGGPDRDADPLPLGEACLAWSFNRDGEVDPRLVEERDRLFGVDTRRKRAARQDLASLARPQHGVDALDGAFPHADGRPAGVADADAAEQRR